MNNQWEQVCDVVNMDTLPIYAVTPVCVCDAGRDVECIYVGTVTDSTGDGADDADVDWESDLIEAVQREDVHPHDTLLTLLVERVLPALPSHG